MPFKVVPEAFGIFRKAEEIILLADPFRLGPVNRTVALDQILFLFERFAGDAIPALVVSLVDVAGGRHLPH